MKKAFAGSLVAVATMVSLGVSSASAASVTPLEFNPICTDVADNIALFTVNNKDSDDATFIFTNTDSGVEGGYVLSNGTFGFATDYTNTGTKNTNTIVFNYEAVDMGTASGTEIETISRDTNQKPCTDQDYASVGVQNPGNGGDNGGNTGTGTGDNGGGASGGGDTTNPGMGGGPSGGDNGGGASTGDNGGGASGSGNTGGSTGGDTTTPATPGMGGGDVTTPTAAPVVAPATPAVTTPVVTPKTLANTGASRVAAYTAALVMSFLTAAVSLAVRKNVI